MNQSVRQHTWLQHLSSALLLLICLIRAIQDLSEKWRPGQGIGLVLLVGVLVATYLIGPRFVRSQSSPRLASMIWLSMIALLWVVLVLISAEFIWLAFVLWMLAGHVLNLAAGISFSVIVLFLAIAIPWTQSGPPHAAAIIGPGVGMLFAFGVSRGQLQLIHLAQERADLLTSLIRAQDELAVSQREAGALAERTRLSRDIHDTLAQGFASILLLARAGLSTDSDSEQLLTQIARTAGENLEESRRIVAALTPAALEEQPLVAALDRLATRLEEETGISTHLETTGVPTLAIEQEIAMLRVAQSALANVRQHSAAQQVQISVSADDDILTLSVIDDGHGFDAQRKPDSESGYGLAAMRTRLAELGGHLEVSTSTTGTTLLATVPILRVS